MPRHLILVALLSLMTTACASLGGGGEVRAPQPARAIDAERFYSGRWLEIGRLPMGITDGCVAGATIYERQDETRVAVRDTCQVGSPTGRERGISGRGEILDPGTNAKLRVNYLPFVTWEYWVLDRAEDYSWFISSDPQFDKLFIYTREVPTEAERLALVERARALGYDVSRLEFPATAP